MSSLRRYSYIAFFVACTHLVFGAIVRISGSGMGCGDHWPKCYGRWFPPLDRPDLIIELSHRYLAVILLLTLIGFLVAAWRRRDEPGVGGRGGVLRSAALAVTLGFSAALLGAVTVKFTNAPFATLAHWTVAMSLVATVVATVIRAGGLGGAFARQHGVSPGTKRAAYAAAAMALVAVVMGGLTAKYPGAAVACQSFPLCGKNPDVQRAAVHVQMTHRIIAVVLILHLFGMVMAQRKKRESLIQFTATIAFSFGILQLLVAGAMIGMHLPPVLRSLHEATGVSIWIATFALAYLARISGDGHGVREPLTAPAPVDLSDNGIVRASVTSRSASATAVAEPRRKGFVEPKEPWQGAEAIVVETVFVAAVEEQPSAFSDNSSAPASVDSQNTELFAEAGAENLRLTADSFDVPDVNEVVGDIDVVDVLEVVEVAAEVAEAVEVVEVAVAPEIVVPRAKQSTMTHSIAVIVARGADT
jgi:heme A synthase